MTVRESRDRIENSFFAGKALEDIVDQLENVEGM